MEPKFDILQLYLSAIILSSTFIQKSLLYKNESQNMYSSSHDPFLFLFIWVGFLIKVHCKTSLILKSRNNLGILGASYIYTNASFSFFLPFRIAHFLWFQFNHVCYSLGPYKLLWNNMKCYAVPASVELGMPLRHYLILLFPTGANCAMLTPQRSLLTSATLS